MSLPADVATLTAMPRDAAGPVFGEPWQAQAFAMTLMLLAGPRDALYSGP